MKLIEITLCHPSSDTRIYQKYIKSLLKHDIEVGYVAPFPIVSQEENLHQFFIKKSGFFFIRIFRLLKKTITIYKFSPDFIHIHDPEILLLCPLYKLLGFKIIYDMHENFFEELNDKPINNLNRFFQKTCWRLINKYVLSKLKVVFAEESYKNHFPQLKDSIIVQNFPKINPDSITFKKIKLPIQKPKFVYLGTISYDRGAIKMQTALNSIFGPNNFELHFIGEIKDKKLEAELNKTFSENKDIFYHGYRPMKEAWNICRDFDIGLAVLDKRNNYIDSYPTKIFEYLICGLPIVTSNFKLYRKLVEKKGVGFCVNPDNPTEIKNTLKKIIDDKNYIAMQKNIKNFPFYNFSWDNEFSNFLQFLK